MKDHVAEEILGTMPAEESGRTVVRARLDCGCILEKMVAGHDIVVGALSSGLGLATVRTVIESGRNYCDISFMPARVLLQDFTGVPCVVDLAAMRGAVRYHRHEVEIEFHQADLTSSMNPPWDLIVANLPYMTSAPAVQPR